MITPVAGPAQLGRSMGTLGPVVALGPAAGPAIGGLLLEVVSWRWLFGSNVPVGVVALAAARGLVPGGTTRTAHPLDRRGLVLLGVGLPALLYGATEAGSTGARPTAVLTFVVGASMAVGRARPRRY